MSEYESRPQPFPELGPTTVLNLVEAALGVACTNLCRPLNSYINRVYELETEEGQGLVAKFYRPGRWSRAAVQDEHHFLRDLAQHEIPVIEPLTLSGGETLGEHENLCFGVFPRCGGRSFDEYNEEQWLELGRLLGRCHAIGAVREAPHRMRMVPDHSTREQVRFILDSGLISWPDLAGGFAAVCEELIEETAPRFKHTRLCRIHGDCHFANLIHRPGESFYIIDFDDMVMGPPVQDLWMLLPDSPDKSLLEIDLFLEGYETFQPFDRRSFRLIEPLRAMRFLHYCAWLSFQYLADGAAPLDPHFGSREYWQHEINDLRDQLQRIREQDADPLFLG